MSIKDKASFLKEYCLSEDEFAKTELDWIMLDQIHDSYLLKIDNLLTDAEHLSKKINKAIKNEIHSTKYRVKDSEHLIAKIIRKKIDNPDRVINLNNYETEITDLIGIRVLHLFKNDWTSVHEYIKNTWDLIEKPVAYIRSGDDDSQFTKRDCQVKVHPKKYRSVHYLIKHIENKQTTVAEIQVRTIFEEAWSEIDHKVRYPHNTENAALSEFLDVFNRLAGSADEMGTFLTLFVQKTSEMEQNHKEELVKRDEEISALQKKIARMNIPKDDKRELTESVAKLTEPIELSAQAGKISSLSSNTLFFDALLNILITPVIGQISFPMKQVAEKLLSDSGKLSGPCFSASEKLLSDSGKLSIHNKKK